MAATVDDVKFLAPGLSVPDAVIQRALDMAEDYRPACLPEKRQDMAQAWYALWLLSLREQSGNTSHFVSGIVSSKEGDNSVTFGAVGKTGEINDPMGYYAQYKALADLCGVGAVMVGRAFTRGGC